MSLPPVPGPLTEVPPNKDLLQRMTAVVFVSMCAKSQTKFSATLQEGCQQQHQRSR